MNAKLKSTIIPCLFDGGTAHLEIEKSQGPYVRMILAFFEGRAFIYIHRIPFDLLLPPFRSCPHLKLVCNFI